MAVNVSESFPRYLPSSSIMSGGYYKNKDLLEGAHKPKSPDTETINYLCQIEGLLDDHRTANDPSQQHHRGGSKTTEDDDDQEEDAEEERREQLALLVNNVHDEIAGQQAALSIDKSASMILEKLLVLSTPAQLRQFGASLRGYFVFLSSHRFGSHVLQKFLTLMPATVHDDKTLLSSFKGSDEAEENSMSSDEGPPITMEDVLCDLCEEVGDRWISLAKDLCGTHVMRSLLQAMTGRVPKYQSNASGKGKKKNGIDV